MCHQTQLPQKGPPMKVEYPTDILSLALHFPYKNLPLSTQFLFTGLDSSCLRTPPPLGRQNPKPEGSYF